MKKLMVGAIVLVCLISLFLTFIPNVLSQPENAEVLSYSWYVSSEGYVAVVGEVQNVGSNIVEFISLQGVVYNSTDEPQAIAYNAAYSQNIQPQQKAPFIIYVTSENSFSGDLSWVSDIDDVSVFIIEAKVSEDYQYQDLEITGSTNYIDSYGYYTVSGNIRNTGDRTAGRPWVVATFYNATGNVVGIGYSDYLDVLSPGQTTSFTVTNVYFPTELSDQITDYALVIQTEAPIFPNGPFEPPGSSPTSEATSEAPTTASPSSEAPTDTSPDGSIGNTGFDLTPLLIAVPIVLAVILGAAFFYRRKKLNHP
jgi:hypothetical protein